MQALRKANFMENEMGFRTRLYLITFYEEMTTREELRVFEEVKAALPVLPVGCHPPVFLSYQFLIS